jgi:hypothetical protein
MSTATFIATLAPKALHLGVVIGLVAWIYHTRQRPVGFYWLMMGAGVLASILVLLRVARYRMMPRMVGATRDTVYYRDASTGGRVVELPRQDLSSIGVRRSAFRLYHVVAVPKTKSFMLTLKSTEPIVLLTALDRDTLERIAAALRDVPEPRT